MEIRISRTPEQLGQSAARHAAYLLNQAIAERGEARLLLSTGASQFEALRALVKENVQWDKVTMFHLDEYVGLPETHIASFRKYLKERFISLVPLKAAWLVDGTREGIARITEELRKAPIDVGLIGIGENSHIAFNDPPADLETKESYIIVDLDERCKQQQCGEGWFASVDEVPKQAVSMTVYQILQCRTILSIVPHAVKAEAVYKALYAPQDAWTPASQLRTHPDWTLYLDRDSAEKILTAGMQWPEA